MNGVSYHIDPLILKYVVTAYLVCTENIQLRTVVYNVDIMFLIHSNSRHVQRSNFYQEVP